MFASTMPMISSTGSSRHRRLVCGSPRELRKRPAGTRQLEEVWEEWSLATQWPLTEDLVLSDRDEDAAEILRWLRGEPSVLSIQATTTDEAVAFFHATLSMLPDEIAANYRARCLVATDAAAARALTNAPAPQIIVLTEPDPGLARSLAERGHFVLQAYDDRPLTRGEVRKLARPSREGIASALIGAGIADLEPGHSRATAPATSQSFAASSRALRDVSQPGRRSRRRAACWRPCSLADGTRHPKPTKLSSRSWQANLMTKLSPSSSPMSANSTVRSAKSDRHGGSLLRRTPGCCSRPI